MCVTFRCNRCETNVTPVLALKVREGVEVPDMEPEASQEYTKIP